MKPELRGRFVQHLALPMSLSLVALMLFAGVAEAQIWIVERPDGSKEYTTQYVKGAEVYMPTPNTPVPSRRGSGDVPFRAEIDDASRTNGVDPLLVEAVIATESAFHVDALSDKGAQGLMQLMPETARRFGVGDVWDPRQNIHGGTAYLAELQELFGGHLPHVLAAYNAGEGAVQRYGGIPPYRETRNFVDRVLAYLRRQSDNDPSGAPAAGS